MKILIVASHIPVFDSNAGDYRVFHIARILSQKYKVFFIPLRFGWQENDYIVKLKDFGVEVVFPGYCGIFSLEDLIKKEKFKLVLFEFYHTAKQYIDEIRKYFRARIIIDSHCLKFRELLNKNWEFSRKIIKEAKREELDTYKKADLIITVTEKERNILKRYMGVPIETVFTGTEVPGEIRERRGRKNILFVGYMRNHQNEDAVIYFVNKIYPYIKKEIPEVKFYIVGSSPTERVKKLSNRNVIITGYVKDITLFYNSFMVSVVPLRIGSGMKSKVIESLAWGCPVVSTSIGAEGMGLKDGKNILITDNPKNFAKKIIRVYTDEKLWYNLSIEGYKTVKRKYGMKLMEEKLLNLVMRCMVSR